MQMTSRNRNGITLISLIITIIVLFIILSITLNYGLSELHDVSNKKTESELTIVQEAIMQRYALVKSENQLGLLSDPISADKVNTTESPDISSGKKTQRPEGFVGTRIANPSSTIGANFPGIPLLKSYNSGESGLTYEEYYYLLDEKDLLNLGIEKGDDSKISNDVVPKARSYIVNYLTGEVFDVANKKYYKTDITKDNPIYTQPTVINMTTENFNYDD